MRLLAALSVLFFAHTGIAQHNHGSHGQPVDTSDIPVHLKVAHSTNDPMAQEARKNVVRKLYNGLIHPAPIPVLAGTQSIDDIFQKGVVQGRVSPAGSYSDFTSALEYFYALAETPMTRVDKVTITSLVASDDKVAVEVDLHFCKFPFFTCDINAIAGGSNFTLKEMGFFTFNEENRIISFDLVIPNLGSAMDVPDDQKMRDGAIAATCVLLTQMHANPVTGKPALGGTCTKYFDEPSDFPEPTRASYGTNAFQNCVKFMHTIPFGTWNRANSNSVVCRQLHSLLTPLRPDDHCPHTSPNGGGKCIEFPYETYFEKDY